MEPLAFKNAGGVFEFLFEESRRGHFTTEETVIISDWDDTLNISHALSGKYAAFSVIAEECPEIPKELQDMFDIVANATKEFLTEAVKYGRVLIVTNASEGWVQLCCKRFMPSIYDLVTSFTIISAREYYESQTSSPHKWKQYVFRDIVLGHFSRTSNKRKNIISIGDGTAEQYAMRSLRASCYEATNINLITTKTIRLMGLVNAETMARQLKHVTDSLDKIVHYDLSIDIDVGFDVFASFKSMPRISTEFRFVDPADVKKEEDEEEKLCEMGLEILCECKKCRHYFQTIMRYT
ncbi:MAG: hypothetical protein EBU84_17585 [Actinobacteria bacterium]|nr:hypothetical protein [Actinomycetota bacterium]